MLNLTRDLLGDIAKMSPAKRLNSLKLVGALEYDKCSEDIFYWLDANQHGGIPYVYTLDPHPMYVCKNCDDRNIYPFAKLKVHLETRHDIFGLKSKEVHSFFTELPTKRPFPSSEDPMFDYMRPIIENWLAEPLICIEKSRDMMATWLIVTLYTWDTYFHSGRQNIFQSDKASKSMELVKRAVFLLKNQPKFIRDQHKILLQTGNDRSGILTIPSINSEILGFAQGPDQIRQLHPTGVMIDEAAFHIQASEGFAAIKPSIQNGGRFTMVSTPNPGFFYHVCRDLTDQLIEG